MPSVTIPENETEMFATETETNKLSVNSKTETVPVLLKMILMAISFQNRNWTHFLFLLESAGVGVTL